MTYKHIVLGGTFDGLHRGHIHFLSRAFEEGRQVTIGLTSEAYIRRFKKSKVVSPFSRRYEALTRWLRKRGYAPRATIVPLDNPWGPAILGEFDAIEVTKHNKETAIEINTIRRERGIGPLAIFEVTLVQAFDRFPISSTRVRTGEIDKRGHLRMPDNLRPFLQKPLGRILDNCDVQKELARYRDDIVVTVGDVTTQAVFLCGIRPALAIIDLCVERRPFQSFEAYKFPKHYDVVHVTSGPGYIAGPAIQAIEVWSKTIKERRRVVIVVDGEEDLLTLPAIVHAPLGSVIFYGQPPKGDRAFGTYVEGLVEVKVTAAKKKEAQTLLEQFI